MNTTEQRLRTRLLIAGALIAAGVFLLDVVLVRGIAGGVMYVAVVLLFLFSPDPRDIVRAALLSMALTVLGYFLAPAGGEFWHVLLNHLLELFAIWVTAALSYQRRRGEEDQQRLQEEILQRQARGQAILDAAVDGIVTIDSEGRIESFNGAAESMFGWREQEVRGRNLDLLMPQPFRDEHAGYLSRYLATGTARIIGVGREVLGQHRDGRTFPIHISVSEVRLVNQRLFTGIIRDLTEHYKLQRQVHHQERLAAVGQLAAGIAHEIGNPLASVSAVVQNLRRKVLDEHLSRKLDLIESHVTRIAGITRTISQLGRPAPQLRASFSLNEAVNGGVGILRYDKRAREIDFQIDLAEDLPRVYGRRNELEQVFLNLGLNALDALEGCAEGHPRVLRIATRGLVDGDAPRVQVEVGDSGPGIPPEVAERVFDPFFTTKETGRGTGLGLSVSANIVHEHGGSLYVEGNPGTGAHFYVELPVGGVSESDPTAVAAASGTRTSPSQ